MSAEVERLRTALEKIAATHERNRWHPKTEHPTELSRRWHDGYISCAAEHGSIAKAALDPEQAAENNRVWRIGCEGSDSDWFRETGHCGHCGVVASACECDGECGCWEDHGPPLKPWKGVLQDRYDAGFLDGLTAGGGSLESVATDDLNTPCPHGNSPVTCVACLNNAVDETAVLAELEEGLE